MRARIGDRIVVERPRDDLPARQGTVIAVQGERGAPPYRVRWSDDGRETLLFPGPDAHIESAGSVRPEERRAEERRAEAMIPGPRQEPTMKRWNVAIAVTEESDGDSVRTVAEAELSTNEWANLRGHGEARKNPTDVDVPEIGDELAVARALDDLAHKLRRVAADDIVDHTGTAWQPT